MRRAAILAIGLLLASTTGAQAASVPKVSGDYTYAYAGGTSSVTLDALATDPGSGTFSWARDTGQWASGHVTCVVINDQEAWIIGVVDETNTGPLPAYWMARVHDGGLPGGTGDAAVSFLGPGTPPPGCTFPYQWNLTAKWMVPIASGNIRIH
ncbi:MAG TPA: hypothetical protein VF763_07580 [Candidatus Limnocylindrales bacterium]